MMDFLMLNPRIGKTAHLVTRRARKLSPLPLLPGLSMYRSSCWKNPKMKQGRSSKSGSFPHSPIKSSASTRGAKWVQPRLQRAKAQLAVLLQGNWGREEKFPQQTVTAAKQRQTTPVPLPTHTYWRPACVDFTKGLEGMEMGLCSSKADNL